MKGKEAIMKEKTQVFLSHVLLDCKTNETVADLVRSFLFLSFYFFLLFFFSLSPSFLSLICNAST